MIARAIFHLGVSTPAVMVMSAGPVAAARPDTLWLPLCSGGETHWIALPRDPAAPAAPPRDDRHGLCAHATCPRETKVLRKARLIQDLTE